jgi:hypothetical protein
LGDHRGNESGLYQVPLLQPGRYSITARKTGFRQATRESVALEVNQVAKIDFTLEPGALSETIEVSAAPALLEANTSSVGQVIESRSVSDLPLNGRNFAQLAILGAGVVGVGYAATGTIGSGTRPDDMRPGTELFSNGNREQSNNFMLDGVDNNFRRNGLITLRPSVEDIREFKIQTNLFQAEQGRNPGATISVITKSGSNQFNGSVYEFFRNAQLDAKNFFAKPGPKAQLDQFSASPARAQDGLPPIPRVEANTLIGNPSGNFNVIPPNYKTGYAQRGNLGIEQEIPRWAMVLKAAYATNLARKVDSNFNINTPDPGPGTPQSRRPLRNILPNVVNATYGDTTGHADYHSLQITGERRFVNGLSWLGAYTYSHSIDNVPTQQGGGQEGPVPQDIRYRFLDRGSSAFDIRHRTSQSVAYNLPFGRGRRFNLSNSFVNALFGGWQINGILTLQSGLPFTPTLATSVSNAGGSRPDRLTPGVLSDPALTHWFDTGLNAPGAAWATPLQYTYGNGGRNILRGAHRTNFDGSLFKETNIRERLQLQFRAEFFNAFNHPQFDLPNATIGSAAADVISSTVGSPRDIQLSLRLWFGRR